MTCTEQEVTVARKDITEKQDSSEGEDDSPVEKQKNAAARRKDPPEKAKIHVVVSQAGVRLTPQSEDSKRARSTERGESHVSKVSKISQEATASTASRRGIFQKVQTSEIEPLKKSTTGGDKEEVIWTPTPPTSPNEQNPCPTVSPRCAKERAGQQLAKAKEVQHLRTSPKQAKHVGLLHRPPLQTSRTRVLRSAQDLPKKGPGNNWQRLKKFNI